jgi:hypothetical protein
MIEDRELDSWREQWSGVAEPASEFQRKIWQRIKRHDRRFVVGNVLEAFAFTGILIFAVILRHQSSWLGTGWATGICILVCVSVGYRIWILRGTWRPETQSTRAFVELWQRRVLARMRLLRIAVYVSMGWIAFCAVLALANWGTIGPDVKARPRDWLEVLVACVLMQPVIWFWVGWLRRRKVAELNEVRKLLDEMND